MNRKDRRRFAKTSGQDEAEQLKLAFQKHQAGDLPAAESLYRKILHETPNQPDALRLLGELLIDRGKADEAIALLRQIVQLQPKQFLPHYSLANALRMAGQVDAAILSYQSALALNSGFAGTYHGLGMALRALERDQDAAGCFREAVKLMPGWALAWKDLGLTLAILGELPEAAKAFEKAIALDPGLADARRHLAAIKQGVAGAEEAKKLQARAAGTQTPVAERIDILFTLGRQADKAGETDMAFQYYAEANALLRAMQHKAGIGYDRARMTRDVDQIIATFNTGMFAAREGWGDASALPVFILGMPRAGSTLVEQIAASHTKVFGAGEFKGIGGIARRIGWNPSASWTADSIHSSAKAYLQTLQLKAGDTLRICDKMLDNIFQLGLIAHLFPGAQVIFCERDLRDTCLSCFFQHFSEAYAFDTSLEDCVHRFFETQCLVNHWREVLPLKTMTVRYEDLIDDLEAESRRLIDFLGLDWEPGCLKFHETKRSVRTASWSQVRQPLYKESVGRWRRYQDHIAPLIEAERLFKLNP